ncbi:hypothetical protein SAMN04488128_105106 [Chitinophaga eiseniae]|uniref:Uncharacterized protein n=1 Tax=Chitinophaga eiseniae TaxID=634771 RepID=A0A1T4TI99_9BACT|nr:hypothetical protein [Chitinophaga eiseniae]SKA40038.1 hypothetical protein SAMN04488128_105106 [Chitinophaga eiseniae]
MKLQVFGWALLLLISCHEKPRDNAWVLYNENPAFIIKCAVPQGRIDYKDMPSFPKGELLYVTYKGAPDTSSWMTLSVHEIKLEDRQEDFMESLLQWQQKSEADGDSTFTLVQKK